MRVYRLKLKLITLSLIVFQGCASGVDKNQLESAGDELERDLRDKSGMGCTQSKPSANEIIEILCKSTISHDAAWEQSMEIAKNACESQLFGLLFNKLPGIPEIDGVFGTQMEIKCKERL